MGRHLLTLCGCFGLQICSGTSYVKEMEGNTYTTLQGSSVIDYVFMSLNARHILKYLKIEEETLESNHRALSQGIIGTTNDVKQQSIIAQPRLRMDYKKAHTYEREMETGLSQGQMPSTCHKMNKYITDLLQTTTKKCFDKNKVRRPRLPCKHWYD